MQNGNVFGQRLGFIEIEIGAALRGGIWVIDHFLFTVPARLVRDVVAHIHHSCYRWRRKIAGNVTWLHQNQLRQNDKRKYDGEYQQIEEHEPSQELKVRHHARPKVALNLLQRIAPQLHFGDVLGPLGRDFLPGLSALPFYLLEALQSQLGRVLERFGKAN